MADQDFKIVITSTADTTGFKDAKSATDDLSKSIPESWQGMEKLGDKTKGAGESGEKFSMKGREMKQVLNQLDGVVPGLGKSIEGLGQVITGTGGAMIVLQLAFEAAKIYVEMYNEAVERSEKMTAARFDSMREAARNALNELEEYRKKMDEATKRSDPVADKLAADRAVLSAEFKGRRQLLQTSQESEMAQAQTPEQREAIKRKYSALGGRLDAEQSAADLNLLKSVIEALTKERDAAHQERTKLKDDMDAQVEARGKAMEFGISTKGFDEYIAELSAKMAVQGEIESRAQRQLTDYGVEGSRSERVFNTNAGNTRMMELANTTVNGNQTLSQLVNAAGLNQKQQITLFNQMLSGQLSMMQVVQGLLQRVAQQQHQLANMSRFR